MVIMAPILLILSVSLIGVIVKVATDRHRRCEFPDNIQTKPASAVLVINGNEYQFPHVTDKTGRLKLAVEFCSAQGTVDWDTNLVNNINSIFNELNLTEYYKGSSLGFTVETFATCANNVADKLELKMCSCGIPVANDNPREVRTASDALERDVIIKPKQIYEDINRIEVLDATGRRNVVAMSPENWTLEEDRLSKDTEVRELKEIQDSGEFGDTVGIPNKIKNIGEGLVTEGIEEKVMGGKRTVVGDADDVKEKELDVKREIEGSKMDMRGEDKGLLIAAQFVKEDNLMAETEFRAENAREKIRTSEENITTGEIRRRKEVVTGQLENSIDDVEIDETGIEEDIQMERKTENEISMDNLIMKNVLNDMPQANIVAAVETENFPLKEVCFFHQLILYTYF